MGTEAGHLTAEERAQLVVLTSSLAILPQIATGSLSLIFLARRPMVRKSTMVLFVHIRGLFSNSPTCRTWEVTNKTISRIEGRVAILLKVIFIGC